MIKVYPKPNRMRPTTWLIRLAGSALIGILQSAEKDDERVYKDIGRSRWFTFAYVVMGLIVFLFLTVYFAGSDKELYKEMLKLGIVAAGGFGGGFGLKTYLDRNR